MFHKNIILLLIIVSTLLISCTMFEDDDEIPETPTSGQITIYTAIANDQVRAYTEVFEAAYPDIEVTLVRQGAVGLTNLLLDEIDNPQADVIWGLPATNMMLLEWRGLLKTYEPAGMSRLDSRFLDTQSPPYWVGIQGRMLSFCVNTVRLAELGLPAPQSWQDLTEPQYAGHIVMTNPAQSASGNLWIATILQIYGNVRGWDYLYSLHENTALYVGSAATICEFVGSGEYPIAVTFGYRAVEERQKGNPVEVIFPAEGSGWDLEVNALVRKDDIKPASRTFLDWAISDQAMDLYIQNRPITSIEIVSLEAFPTNPSAQLYDQDIPWMAANYRPLLSEWMVCCGDNAPTESSQ